MLVVEAMLFSDTALLLCELYAVVTWRIMQSEQFVNLLCLPNNHHRVIVVIVR